MSQPNPIFQGIFAAQGWSKPPAPLVADPIPGEAEAVRGSLEYIEAQMEVAIPQSKACQVLASRMVQFYKDRAKSAMADAAELQVDLDRCRNLISLQREEIEALTPPARLVRS